MLRTHLLAALLATLIATPVLADTAAATPAPSKNAAVVNGKAIPAEMVDLYLKELAKQGRAESPELRKMVVDELVSREVFMQEAQKQKLAERPEVSLELENARQHILMRAVARAYIDQNPVTDAEIQAEYDKQKAAVTGTEYQARHILVATEKEAKALIAKLKAGASFEKLAKVSKDSDSAAKGGELGWSTPDAYVPEFAQALQKMQKGQLAPEPVKSQYGWHVIRLDDTRPVAPPTLESVKQQIVESLQQSKFETYRKQLRDAAAVKYE